MATTPTELALFKLTVKQLSVEFPKYRRRESIKCKLYVDNLTRNKGTLKDSKQNDENIWFLGSGLTILASSNSMICLSLFKRRFGVWKRDIASFRFVSAALLSGPPADDYEEEKTFSITDIDHIGITLRTITVGEPEPVNAVAHRLLEERNSVVETLKKHKDYIDALDKVAKVISEPNSFASAAVGLVSKIWEKCRNVLDLDDALIKLLKDITDLIPDLATISKNAKLSALKETVAEMEKKINEAVLFIDGFRSANFVAKSAKTSEGNKLVTEIKELCALLQMRMNVQQFQEISEAAKKKLLETLNPVSGADTNHQHHPCLDGTRVAIISEMTSWVSKDETTMFWLNGLPGVGKSTIACSVVQSLRASGVPTVPFFCLRNNNNYNDATRVIQTLVYYLACLVPNFGDCLLQKLDDRGLDSSPFAHYSESLRNIVRDALEATHWDGRAVLLVDALDECAIQREQATLAKGLLELTQRCNWLKVVVTSRPYKNIERFFTDVEEKRVHEINYKMSVTDPLNLFGDLVKYTEHCFKLSLANEREKVELLARRANGLFQWVSVASQFVEDSVNKMAALSTLLDLKSNTNADAMEELYVLYQVVLTECLNLKLTANATAYSTFLTALIALKTPLHAKAMSTLVDNLDSDTIKEICKSLRSVINVDERGLIVVAHQSFVDYLSIAAERKSLGTTEKIKSSLPRIGTEFLVPRLQIHPAPVADANIVSKCLDIMLSGLKFNICALETSTRFNKDISDLGERIKDRIPMQLQYACLHWQDHYGQAQSLGFHEAKLMTLLSTEKMLFWLEILSLTGNIEVAMQIQHLKGSQESETLAGEIYCFVNAFSVPIARSTPHLYVSALPFVPRQSAIYKMTRNKFLHLADVVIGYDNHWTITSTVLHCQSFVDAVAFSPDGRKIMSVQSETIKVWDVQTGTKIWDVRNGNFGFPLSVIFSPGEEKMILSGYRESDKTIRVWDVQTGSPIGAPLEGYSDHYVFSDACAFSPDGRKFTSGLLDKTIRVWDVQTGIQIGQPLKGHTDYVQCVAFSLDGKQIVSGSRDRTIRVWDVQTSIQIGEPLKGHSGTVNSVALSSDGRKIVSASDDKTARLWDVQAGTQIGEPLERHSGSVSSVAFSPDGRKVVYVSNFDYMIWVWDVRTMTQIGEPLEGHSGLVQSVAFSPDGRKIASGSQDKTIRIWDVQTSTQIRQSLKLKGHSDLVPSVAFSPDGTRFVSGSRDKTVRVWDVRTGIQIGESLEGHTSFVQSVAFSSDGRKIVSGSLDRTVRVWDVHSSTQIGQPLEGHSGRVWSVALSPDGTKAVSGSEDFTIRLWDLQTGTQIGQPLKGHSGPVHSVAFSPDGRQIVSGSQDMTIRMWDVWTGAQIGESLEGHADEVNSVAFSSDGKNIVSGSGDGTVRIWDVEMGNNRQIGEPQRTYSGGVPVRSVTFSQDGRKVVSGADDRMVRVWDAQTGTQIGEPLKGHIASVWSIAVSPDGRKIVSGSQDGTIRLWDVETENAQASVVRRGITSTANADGNTHHLQKSCRELNADGWMYLEEGESPGPLLWIPSYLRHGV